MITKNFNELYDSEGFYKIDTKYKEIFKLATMLFNIGIPFNFHNLMDGWQIEYFTKDKKRIVCSVIEHFGSYGNYEDKLEIMGLLTPEEEKKDCVLGSLTAREVFERIQEHYKNNFYKEG